MSAPVAAPGGHAATGGAHRCELRRLRSPVRRGQASAVDPRLRVDLHEEAGDRLLHEREKIVGRRRAEAMRREPRHEERVERLAPRGRLEGLEEEIALLVRDGAERLVGIDPRQVCAKLREIRGARELLESLVAQGVPCALVTMSWELLATAVVENLPEGTFDAVVTGDVVLHGKPHPEPYLYAARLLHVDLAACIAIEDSPPGVASAVAAGIRTIAVPHQVKVPETVGAVQISTLTGLTPADLLPLFG